MLLINYLQHDSILKGPNKFKYFWQGFFEVNTGQKLLKMALGKLARYHQGHRPDTQVDFLEEFLKVKSPGNTGKMGIEVIWLFQLNNKFKVFERNIGAKV